MPRNINYKALVSEGTFIHDYMQWMDAQETPYVYDFFCALWLMGVVLGREVIVDRPRAPVYLNNYTILVSESGIMRKSTSIRSAVSILRAVLLRHPDAVPIIEAGITPEGLIHALAERTKTHGNAHAAIAVSELVTFMGREGYMRAMPGLLTDLYDSAAYRTGGITLGQGSKTLEQIYLNFLSASTPTWLLKAINPDVIEGGFTSRVLFVCGTKRKRSVPWPQDDNRREEAITQLGSTLIQWMVAPSTTHVGLSETAHQVYANWYNTRRHSQDAFRASFESREDSHVLRIAALLSINDNKWEIAVPHLRAAIRIVNEVKETAAQLFEEGPRTSAPSKLLNGLSRLREILLEKPNEQFQQTVLYRRLQGYFSAKELAMALDILHNLGLVRRYVGRRASRGPTPNWYQADAAMRSGEAMELAVQRVMAKIG